MSKLSKNNVPDPRSQKPYSELDLGLSVHPIGNLNLALPYIFYPNSFFACGFSRLHWLELDGGLKNWTVSATV